MNALLELNWWKGNVCCVLVLYVFCFCVFCVFCVRAILSWCTWTWHAYIVCNILSFIYTLSVIKYAHVTHVEEVENINGHSTRSIGPSQALFNGTYLKQIMVVADWSRENTFIKQYLKSFKIYSMITLLVALHVAS